MSMRLPFKRWVKKEMLLVAHFSQQLNVCCDKLPFSHPTSARVVGMLTFRQDIGQRKSQIRLIAQIEHRKFTCFLM